MHNVFRAGVEPGGLNADYEIKMMICHILHRIERPMPISALIEVFVSEELGNYFEVASAASKLVESGHLAIMIEEDEHCYTLTDLGNSSATTLEKDLPIALRERAVRAAERYFVKKERRVQNTAHVKRVEDGYLLTLTIEDVGSDLLRLTILLPDKKSCTKISQRFVEDPVFVYKGIVAVLTGDSKTIGFLLEKE